MAAVGAADAAPGLPLRKFLRFMAAFHTDVFMFNLMYFPVDGKADFLRWPVHGIVPELRRCLICFFKVEPGFAPAAALVNNTSFDNFSPFRHGLSRRVQLIRFFLGFADIPLQLRRSAFLVGELQPGRRALPYGLALLHSLIALINRPLGSLVAMRRIHAL
ncbi:hypothetical protein SDC9_75453 [bioreactor metagenome]|uniref:Uncharacterized protein n=1 Tax=bioreactor metagenome TaxID=1076179 RepID=A0A644YK11_9ZZZZ